MAKLNKDHAEIFHDYGLHVPTRTIVMEGNFVEDGEDGGVNYYMTTFFIKNFHMLQSASAEPITVIMNTVGGDIWQGMAIYDMIERSRCHVTIEVIGLAASMGSIILQAADERKLMPHSHVMFHLGSPDCWGNNIYEVMNSAKYEYEFGEKIDVMLFNKIKKKKEELGKKFTRKEYDEMNFKGKFLHAEEAIEMGLADSIIEKPTL